MQNPLMQTIEALAKEKGIEADTIITAIEDAVLTASRKYYKTNENLKTRFNPETGQVDLFAIKQIVAEVANPATEISLAEAQTLMFTAPLLAVWPGLAIMLAVLGLNLLGDGLRDLLDPKLGD